MEQTAAAVIYPILPHHLRRLYEGKDVFCKYAGKGRPNVAAGSKLIFYLSGGAKQLVGEAIIREVLFMTPDEILRRFGGRLFITAEELDRYRGDRPKDRKLLVLVLSNIMPYEKPLKPPKVVTMAGCVLSEDEYRKLRGG
jgi:hypothetical protein